MRFISVREFRGSSGDVWKELLTEQELVITSNGKPIAIVSAVSEETLEDALRAIRRARAMAAVQVMQRQSAKRGLATEDVSKEISAARSERVKVE
ncbi:MAG: type II toxin-antitoxin system Phd/YefM family antitoxin [Acidobacteria bacterium]|nr:MAG: type II toxin-antitoxin system Phd/YefM family antitoxin [Acidobacteriota bacterium]